MYIILAILIELATILASVGIHLGGAFADILKVSKEGYKVDEKKLEDIRKKVNNAKKSSPLRDALTGALIFIPGLNILWAIVKSIYDRSTIIRELKKADALIPMTEDEKESYSELTRLKDKIAFTMFTAVKEHEEERFVMVSGGHIFCTDPGLRTIKQNRLDPNGFTLDEVKKLNDITGTTYRLGRIDNENTAFIGIPQNDTQFKRIEFDSEDRKITHDYISMTEEEAKDKTFIVYPYRTDDETNKKLEEAVKEIEKARLEKTNEESPVKIYNIMTSDDDLVEKEEEGPVLKKTIGTR